jgi:hypothetical protein
MLRSEEVKCITKIWNVIINTSRSDYYVFETILSNIKGSGQGIDALASTSGFSFFFFFADREVPRMMIAASNFKPHF